MSKHSHLSEPGRQRFSGSVRVGAVVAIVAVALAGWGILHRVRAQTALTDVAQSQSLIPVNVIHPRIASGNDEQIFPGDVQAWAEAPIYARTNGYLKRWLVDIGTPVKAGALLAEIDTPEIDQQLVQAQADLASAQANQALAKSTAARWQDLLAIDSVSRQAADEKSGDAAAKAALLASAKANLARLQQLQGFKHIVAPFAGVVTARNVDVGDLVNSGAGQRELFHIADTHRLRVYVELPQSAVNCIAPGVVAQLHFAEHPNQTYPATVTGTAKAIDPQTRTMRVQLEADNRDNTLLPGAYAEVHFQRPTTGDALRVPANTLLFSGGAVRVATVGADGVVHLKSIQIGRDFGQEVEALTGVDASDTLIVNPPDAMADGDHVKPVATPDAKTKAGKH